jgi:hypothetical protein
LSADPNDDEAEPEAGTMQRRDTKPFYLRVLPLGAFNVQGPNSGDGNGFRKWLRSELRYQGWPVNMVGTKFHGTMRDRDNEGHPGMVSSTTSMTPLRRWPSMQPNVVLVNAGTTDCVYPDNQTGAV